MALGRDALKRAAFKSEKFHSEALGEEVTLREFSAADRIKIMSAFHAAAKAPADQHMAKAQELTARLVQMTLVGEDGMPLYGPDETDAVQDDLPGAVLDEIGDAAAKFVGLGDDEDDDEDGADPKAEPPPSGGETSAGSTT